MNYKAVIFDMDGLLIDSERIARKIFMQTCDKFGVQFKPSVYLQCIGMNPQKGREVLIKGFGRDFPFDEISKVWLEQYTCEAIEKPVPLKPGASVLLRKINQAGLPMAVATSTGAEKAKKKLTNAGIIDYFDIVVAGNQVKKSKPHPEIYQTAAHKLQVKVENCLALEDSNNGVRSAHSAGMSVIQVPDIVPPCVETKKLGHAIVNSLLEVESYLFFGAQ